MKKNDNDKTVLGKNKTATKKFKAIAAAVALGMGGISLSACDPAPTTQTVPEDVAKLSDTTKDGQLVKGKQACIDKMVEGGSDKAEATKICNELEAEALANLRASQPVATNTTTTVRTDNGIADELLLYYMLTNNNRPYVYHSDNSGGMNRVNTRFDGRNPPQAHLNSVQTSYMHAAPAERATVARNLASRPGVKTVTVSSQSGNFGSKSSGSYATSRSGTSSHGIGSGG